MTIAERIARFIASVLAVGALCTAVPWLLVRAAEARFGGPAPWSGVPAPSTWELDLIRSTVTDRITESLIADVVLRVALGSAWVAVLVLLLTVIAEVVHQLRHGGLGLPRVRGLGWGQPAARHLAAGLLVLTSLASTAKVGASPALPARTGLPAAALVHKYAETTPEDVASMVDPPVWRHAPIAPGLPAAYTVEPGDSVYGIAERFAGGDVAAAARLADQILDLNLGRTMPGGGRFVNAAYIEPGWVLELPGGGPDDPGPPVNDQHRVRTGDTLWRIAAERLDDPTRWDEIWELNAGRTMVDGRRFDDPGTIHPGWSLELPRTAAAVAPADGAAREPISETPEESVPDAQRAAEDGPLLVLGSAAPDVEAEWAPEAGPGAEGVEGSVPGGVSAAETADAGPPAGASGDAEVLGPQSVSSASGEVLAEAGVDAAPEVGDRPSTPTAPQLTAPQLVEPQLVEPQLTGSDRSEASEQLVRAAGDGGPADSELAPAEPEQPGWPAAADGLGSGPLVGLGRAAALSAGVLAMVATLRARQLRSARPGARLPAPTPAATRVERRLRVAGIADPLVRLDLAVRCLAAAVADRDVQFTVCTAAPDGTIEFHLTGRVDLPLPWIGADRRWAVPGRTPVDQLAAVARTVDAPAPALAQLGVDPDGREVHVDLEALGTLAVDASQPAAEAVIAAIAAGLAGSPLAEAVRIAGVGLEASCLLAHPNGGITETIDAALADRTIAAEIPSGSSTFALRARGRGGESWDPTVVLAGPACSRPGPITPVRGGRGSALVVAGPELDGAYVLRPDGDRWALTGAGLDSPIELFPVGLDPEERAGLADLVREVTEPAPDPVISVAPQPDRGHALIDEVASSNGSGGPVSDLGDGAVSGPVSLHGSVYPTLSPLHDWTFVVRLLGPVDVVDRSGTRAEFEKSKVLELIAWLVTHRERSTRGAARAALWEADVRDATFSNVVSAARRALGRLVVPPDGQPWIGRSQGDRLPLHPSVVLDADLVEQRLDAARHLDDADAIEILEPAVELVRGLPFEGTSYLWPDGEGITSRLVLVALETCAELARRHLALGDVGGVLRATERGLRVLPGHEALVALRLRAQGRAGDHAALRREWEAYLRVVASDPWGDGEPAAELVALRDELMATRSVGV